MVSQVVLEIIVNVKLIKCACTCWLDHVTIIGCSMFTEEISHQRLFGLEPGMVCEGLEVE